MTAQIVVQNDHGYPIDSERLQQAVVVTMHHEGYPSGAVLSVVIVDNAAVKAMNRQYRGIDAPTDVLSFPADAPPVPDLNEPPYLGDLIIAYPYTADRARVEGHALMDSLMVLVVHGTLHLLGYNHDTPEKRAAMWSVQDEILRKLEISPVIVPGLESYAQDQ